MPGIYVGDSLVTGVYVGDTPVLEVYVGDTKVWPLLLPAGMDKSGTVSIGTYTWAKVTGFTVRSGYPGTVITNNALVVQGSGTGTVTFRGDFAQTGGTQQFRAYRNGVAIGTAVNRGTVATVSGVTVADGDTIELWGYSTYFNSTVAAAPSTYIYFTPT